MELPDTWSSKYAMSSHTYITNCVENLERMCQTTFKAYSTPFAENCHPEEDTSELCSPIEQSFYRSLIGSANWCVTLGRFDIQFALNTLSQYMCAPRIGHLQTLYRIFGYLKTYKHTAIPFDGSEPSMLTHAEYQRVNDWTEVFPDAFEELPKKSPDPLGEPMHITCFVDADHARNQVT